MVDSKTMPLLFLVSDEETALPLNNEVSEWMQRLPGWKLFRQGVTFTQHRTASTACPPARACLYSGKNLGFTNDAAHHTVNKVNGIASETFPSLQGPNMGHYFREQGFRTYYVGKWHLTPDPSPEQLEAHGWSGWNGPEPHGADYETSGWVMDEVYLKQALAIIESQPDPHFVLALNLVNPHDINLYLKWKIQGLLPELIEIPTYCLDDIEPPSKIEQLFIKATREDLWVPPVLFDDIFDLSEFRRFYYTCLQKVDSYLAQCIEAFRIRFPKGMIVRTSDHGSALGTRRGLLGKWMTDSDYVLRIPCGIWYPGVKPQQLSHLTSSIDVLPTILEYFKIPHRLPGINMFKGRDHFTFLTMDNPTDGETPFRIFEKELGMKPHQYRPINFKSLKVDIWSDGRRKSTWYTHRRSKL